MTSGVEKVTLLTEQLRQLLPMKAEYKQRLDKKFRLEFNYNSNHLEGNTLTYGETELLLIFDRTTGNHELREYEEMKGHDVAYELIKELAADNERPLTETTIKNLHSLLLVRPFWKEAITSDGQYTRREIKVGNYKEYPNSVRLPNGEIFHYASPEETPIKMGELMMWLREEEEKNELHPVVLAAMLHYNFVRIHPFDDGNGRLSRLLMNYVLFKHHLPPVVIKSANKKEYLQVLADADSGNPEPFIEYISQQLIWSLDLSINAALLKSGVKIS
ncbi:Fic family protein [Chitinophaga filiformis]|uniref:Fic family protein n=2 Tax=Chitinophaga filiformis TaxID=104663 RepID=A0A1G7QMC4_CHIFI|nr:Fic family protein [Chitinophaga filiformis]